MPYLLLGLALAIFLTGVLRLRGATPHATPWRSFVVWAGLLGAGIVVWAMSAYRG